MLSLHKKDINQYTEVIGKVKDGMYRKIVIKSNGEVKIKDEHPQDY